MIEELTGINSPVLTKSMESSATGGVVCASRSPLALKQCLPIRVSPMPDGREGGGTGWGGGWFKLRGNVGSREGFCCILTPVPDLEALQALFLYTNNLAGMTLARTIKVTGTQHMMRNKCSLTCWSAAAASLPTRDTAVPF